MRVNRALLRERFGRTITRHLEHCPVPLRKSVLAELEAAFPEDFARTAASRFRSGTDISVTNSLAPYFGLFTGHAVQQTDAAGAVRADDARERGRNARAGWSVVGRPTCSASTTESTRRSPRTSASTMLTRFLERYFPTPAPWEHPDAR